MYNWVVLAQGMTGRFRKILLDHSTAGLSIAVSISLAFGRPLRLVPGHWWICHGLGTIKMGAQSCTHWTANPAVLFSILGCMVAIRRPRTAWWKFSLEGEFCSKWKHVKFTSRLESNQSTYSLQQETK